jgi:membrane protein
MLIAPVFLILSGGVTIFIKTGLDTVANSFSVISPMNAFFLKLFAFSLVWAMFVFLYMALPNTKVNFKVALKGAFIAAFLFELLQWAYVTSQLGVGSYNKIYGGFAALPLFLVWIQYSWFVVLFGSELTYAWQNVDHYELESDINNISDRYKRVIALMIASHVVKNFNEGKPAQSISDISSKLDLPIRLTKIIIAEFIETHIFIEVKTINDQETTYQPAISDSKLTVKFIVNKLDEKGVNELPIENTADLMLINKLMIELDEVLNTSKGNMLVKDLK